MNATYFICVSFADVLFIVSFSEQTVIQTPYIDMK